MDEGSLSLPHLPDTTKKACATTISRFVAKPESDERRGDAATRYGNAPFTMNSQTMPEHLFAQVVTDVQPWSNCFRNRATNRA